MIRKPSTFFTVAVAEWMNRPQQEVIDYLEEENQLVREKLGLKRVLLRLKQTRRLSLWNVTCDSRALFAGSYRQETDRHHAEQTLPAIMRDKWNSNLHTTK